TAGVRLSNSPAKPPAPAPRPFTLVRQCCTYPHAHGRGNADVSRGRSARRPVRRSKGGDHKLRLRESDAWRLDSRDRRRSQGSNCWSWKREKWRVSPDFVLRRRRGPCIPTRAALEGRASRSLTNGAK